MNLMVSNLIAADAQMRAEASQYLECYPLAILLLIGMNGLFINTTNYCLFGKGYSLVIFLISDIILILIGILGFFKGFIFQNHVLLHSSLKIVLLTFKSVYIVFLSISQQVRCIKLLKHWMIYVGITGHIIIFFSSIVGEINTKFLDLPKFQIISLALDTLSVLPILLYMYHIYKIVMIIDKNPLGNSNEQHLTIKRIQLFLLGSSTFMITTAVLISAIVPYSYFDFNWVFLGLVGLIGDFSEFFLAVNKNRTISEVVHMAESTANLAEMQYVSGKSSSSALSWSNISSSRLEPSSASAHSLNPVIQKYMTNEKQRRSSIVKEELPGQ
eukprot:NODE_853_length_3701_cov_0.177401.p1 type:complete len:328 gc:universal NODE_853_length_3701_cov_0.177401:529-1512(+)